MYVWSNSQIHWSYRIYAHTHTYLLKFTDNVWIVFRKIPIFSFFFTFKTFSLVNCIMCVCVFSVIIGIDEVHLICILHNNNKAEFLGMLCSQLLAILTKILSRKQNTHIHQSNITDTLRLFVNACHTMILCSRRSHIMSNQEALERLITVVFVCGKVMMMMDLLSNAYVLILAY